MLITDEEFRELCKECPAHTCISIYASCPHCAVEVCLACGSQNVPTIAADCPFMYLLNWYHEHYGLIKEATSECKLSKEEYMREDVPSKEALYP